MQRGGGAPQELKYATIRQSGAQDDTPGGVRCLYRYLDLRTRWRGSPQGGRQSPQLFLRTGGYLTRGQCVLGPLRSTFYNILGGSKKSSTGQTEEHSHFDVVRRPRQDIIFSRPDSRGNRAHWVRPPTDMLLVIRHFHDGMRARIRTDDH